MSSIQNRAFRSHRGLIVFLLAFYAAWCARVVLLLPVDRAIQAPWLQQCWSQSLRLLIWVLPVLLYLKHVDRVPILAFVRLNSFPRGLRLLFGTGIIAAFLALSTASALLFQGGSLEGWTRMTASQWIATLGWTATIAIVEEFLYRGFIFQKLRPTQSFHRANLLNAGLFLLIHWPGWLYMRGLHAELLTLSASIPIIGWVLGLLVEVTRSLWPAILLHALSNVCSTVLSR